MGEEPALFEPVCRERGMGLVSAPRAPSISASVRPGVSLGSESVPSGSKPRPRSERRFSGAAAHGRTRHPRDGAPSGGWPRSRVWSVLGGPVENDPENRSMRASERGKTIGHVVDRGPAGLDHDDHAVEHLAHRLRIR